MITQKKKQFKKKDQFKQKTLVEISTGREEHGITTEEKSEIVIPQSVLAHSQTHPKSNHSNSQKNGEKVPL